MNPIISLFLAAIVGVSSFNPSVITRIINDKNAFHLRLAMGLVSHGQQIGAWSGVGYLVWMAHWACLRYFACPIGAYEGS